MKTNNNNVQNLFKERNNDLSIHLVCGDPIDHSISPMIYNLLYDRYGLSVRCYKAHVSAGYLPEILSLRNVLPIRAYNFTLPHKKNILPLIERIDPTAQVHQSVNTVAVRDGELLAYTTDALGFTYSLRRAGTELCGKDVLVIGAGGAASTIALQVALDGAKSLSIAARRSEAAEILANSVFEKTKIAAQQGNFEIALRHGNFLDLKELSKSADIVIQTTPLGMKGYAHDFDDLAFLSSLKNSAVVCDIVYSPAETTLLKRAKELSLKTVGGIGMLIWQAFAAFEIFTGIKPTSDDEAALCEKLRAIGYDC